MTVIRTTILLILLIAIAVLVSSAVYQVVSSPPAPDIPPTPDTGQTTQQLTVEDAKRIVSEFSGDTVDTISYLETIEFPIGNQYIFSSPSGAYYVNVETGIIEMALFHPAREPSGTIVYSQDEAREIARTYAEQNFPHFRDVNMTLIDEKLLDHGNGGYEYEFYWAVVREGVLTPSIVIISINPSSGEVMGFKAVHRDVLIPLKPEIKEEDVETRALTAFPGIEPVEIHSFLSVSVDSGNQTLIWNIEVKGKPKEGIVQGGIVIIDAITGEILFVDHYQ